MGKTNNPGNKSKPQVKVNILHLLLILAGANCIMMLAPNVGMLNGLAYIPDLYTWSVSIVGIVLLIFGFNGLYKQ